jgi:hypothetical protein
MSRLNKKLFALKQQHQQLKLKLLSAKSEAAQKQADIADPSQIIPSSPSVTSIATGERSHSLSTLHKLPHSAIYYSEKRSSHSKTDANMQDVDLSLSPAPHSLRVGAFAKFRDGDSPLMSPAGVRGRRISQYNLRDFASRAATDSPELFEIPGFEASGPSPPPVVEELRQQRSNTVDLFKTFGNAVLANDAGSLEALMDTYQSSQLQRSYGHIAVDFKEDREHLSVMFRKALIEARKKLVSKGEHLKSNVQSKISVEAVVKLMNELGEPVKLSQVVAFLMPNGVYNSAAGPSVTFDAFFGWWCFYHNKISEAECNGALTSRSQ